MALISALCISSHAGINLGAETMTLDGGSQGKVFFPHKQHQKDDPDSCRACHDLFPQEKDGITLMIGEEKLKARQVMNSLCIKCHREAAKSGKPSGPRSCNACHQK
jgi:hypothetical protein